MIAFDLLGLHSCHFPSNKMVPKAVLMQMKLCTLLMTIQN